MKTNTREFRLLFTCMYALILLTACNSGDQKKETATMEPEVAYTDPSCCTPDILDTTWFSSGKKAPLFSGLEGIRFPITTKSAEARKYFDQGMMLSYGFNHAEAARSFYEAARQDSACAMCWWGYAYVLGPNYNGGMDPGNFQRAYDAVTRAQKVAGSATEKERDLIGALAFRYSADTSMTRPELDSAYAAAMRKVYKKYPGDVDIGALFAESLMDLHPWNLWQKDGTVQPWTPEIINVLEKCMELQKDHAGAHHFYIHAQEMSQHAEKSMPSADLLRDLVPGSGHLVHMPSHTYIRTGMYHEGVLANLRAVAVDSLYTVACHAQGVYPLAYYPHNYHFISACATFSGESKVAEKGALETRDHAHKKLMRDPAWATLQHYYSIPWYIWIKFGDWKAIRNSEQPDSVLKYPNVVWHYANGMAAIAEGNKELAHRHLESIQSIMLDTTIKELTIWGINNIYDLCVIAELVLRGELLAASKNYPEAIRVLKEAVAKEDALNYDEPPDWFFSIRHNLGAVLISAGKFKEAEKVYEEDLKVYRENGWALRGLMNVYDGLGDRTKYDRVSARYNAAWKHADTKIKSSRIL
jgi:tetratricopeptide (TPR) repeat protein